MIGGHPLAAAYLVSNIAFLLALVLLFDLTRREFSEQAARRTITYLCVFPTAFFFMAPYSESLFLLLAVVVFREARLRRLPTAALAGIGAAFTRSMGVILAPALAAETIQAWREDRRTGDHAGQGDQRGSNGALAVRLLAAAAIPLGLVLYLAYWATRGDALVPLRLQATNWQRVPTFPLWSLWLSAKAAWVQGSYWLIDVLIVVPVIALAAGRAVRTRWGYAIYVWLGLVVPLCLVWRERPLMSMPRFVLVLFPLFWVLADLTIRKRVPHTLVVAVSAAGLGLLTVLFAANYYIF